MKIQLKEIPVKEIVEGYKDNKEEGVIGFNGKLDIRPKYQREFIYNDKQKVAVIESILKEYPLNIMYWVDNGDSYELLDGQQRTLSICEYIIGSFSVNHKGFNNLTQTDKDKILNYKLMIYICKGNDKEKLEWFKIINIAGEKLTNQELRNVVYTGEWLTDAKRYFSKTSCPAYNIANRYMKGSPIRQDYLETAIKWISKDNTEEYMSKNQNKPNANELWLYFQNVINWVNTIFSEYKREMKGVPFGLLYNEYKDVPYNNKEMQKEILILMRDEDVTNKSGIYSYVLTRNEKYLSLRTFTDNQKRETYERQNGICVKCCKHYDIEDTEADHITPWSEGGKTTNDNCQVLCQTCNRRKSDK